MKNFTMKLKTSILGAFLAVILVLAGVILGLQYKTSSELMLLSTQKSFENISQKVVSQIEQYDLNSNTFISLLKTHSGIETPMKKGRKHPLLLPITQFMKQANHTYGVYVGYKDESFYQVINLGVSANIKSLLELPVKSRWLVRKHFVKNGVITRVEEVLDRELKLIQIKEDLTNYRFTTRAWYKNALLSDTMVKSDPYIFTSLQKAGVTYSKKVSQDSKSVIGIDISLESLGKMLGSKKLVEKSGAYIFKKDGTILGQYDTYLPKRVNNLNEKYKNLFVENNLLKNPNKQSIVQVGAEEFVTYTQKLSSIDNTDQNIVLFSSMNSIMEPLKQKSLGLLKYIAIAIFLLIVPVVYFVIRVIEKPIRALEIENKKLENGEFEQVEKIDSFIVEINSLSSSLFTVSKAFEQKQKNLELRLEQKARDISNLLNNIGQGFLYFDSQMYIGKKYSKEVKNIFNIEISGMNIMQLLYPQDLEKQQFMTKTLQGILKEEPSKQKILLSLLDKDLIINGKNIKLEYKLLADKSYMLILTDLTKEKELVDKVHREQKILKMVVAVVNSLDQFLEIKKEYERFVLGIDSFTNLGYLESLRDTVHRFKGLFEQKEIYTIVNELDKLQSHLDQSIKDERVDEEILSMSKEKMLSWIEEDMRILKSILGDDFIDAKENISVDVSRIKHILKNIDKYIEDTKKYRELYQDIDKLTKEHIKVFVEPYKKLLQAFGERVDKYVEPLDIDYDDIYKSNELKPFTSQVEGVLSKLDSHTHENDKFQELYGEIEKLTFHNIKVFMEPYKKLVKQLAVKVEKDIQPLILQYDDIFIGEKYEPFFNSLEHLFRNSVEYGIETFEERYATEKPPSALMRCIVQQVDDTIRVSISDDGKGVDLENLRETALEKELYSFEELERMDEQELLMLIFKDEVLTSTKAIDRSGDAIGLSATYKELKKLRGEITCNNTPGLGIEFIFTIPFNG